MAKNNNSKDNNLFDFNLWFNSHKDMILGHDNLSAVEQANLKKEAQLGKSWNQAERGLKRINKAYAQIGLVPTPVPLRNNEGYTLIYKPLDADKYNLRDDQWPSITIENTDDGVTIHNGMWAPEALTFVRGQNGEVGIASNFSTGLNQAADALEAEISRILAKKAIDPKGAYREAKKIVSGEINNLKRLSSTVYSPNQVKEYNKMDQKNVRRKRFESTEAMKTQVDYSNYVHSVYKAVGQVAKGLPTEKQFTRWFEDILTFARGAESVKEIENFVMGNFSWIYDNAWRKEFENFFKAVSGKLKQGTMTEGSSGKVMFGDIDVIAQNFQKAGKKTAQATQLYEQFSHFQAKQKGIRQAPTVARGRNVAFTKNTLKKYRQQIKAGKIDEDSIYKDLYEVAYLNEEAIYNAYKEIFEAQTTGEFSDNYIKVFGKRKLSEKELKSMQLAALKGFGNDAILVSQGMADELNEIQENKRQNDKGIALKDADKYIRDKLIQEHENWIKKREGKKLTGDKKAEYTKMKKELDDLKANSSLFEKKPGEEAKFNYRGVSKFLYKFLHKQYDLDSMTDVKDFDIDNNGNFVDVITSRKMYAQNGVGRAGVTGDIRAVWQKSNDALLALSMLNQGYEESQVYVDPKAKNKELRPSIFQDITQQYSDKNSRTTFMQRFSKIISYIDQNRKIAEEKIKELKDEKGNPLYENLQDYFKKDKILGQYLTLNEDGTIDFNQERFAKDYDNRNKGNRNNTKYNIFNTLKDMENIGKDIGLLSRDKEYIKVSKNGKYFYEAVPMLGMTEFGRSSTDEYAGTGDETHSGFKVDWKVLESLKGTQGSYSKYILDNISSYKKKDESKDDAHQRLMAPITNYINTIEKSLLEKEKDFDYYIKNAQYLKQTYTTDLKKLQSDLGNKEDVFLLELSELQGLGLLTDSMDYGEPGSPEGEYLGAEAFKPLSHIWSNASQKDLDKAQAEGKLILDVNNRKDILRAIPKGTRSNIAGDLIRKLEYERLRAYHRENIKNQKDYLEKNFGIKSYKDIQVATSLGDERLIANIDGEEKAAALLFMGLGDYVVPDAKKGYYMPDETGKQTDLLFNTLLNAYDPLNIDREGGRRKTAYALDRFLKNIQEEYRKGSAYENTHTLTKTDFKESGYLRLLALSGHADEILQDLLSSKKVQGVTRIMSTTDFEAMAKAKIKTKEGRKELLDLYKTTTGKQWKSTGRNNFVTDLTNLFNINAKGYKGYTFDNGAILRNPTIRFKDDVMGGRAILTSNQDLVSPGSMAINKYSAEIQKGDMDGDMVAFMYAFASGDVLGARKALNDYYLKLAVEQEGVDKRSSKVRAAQKTITKLAKELNIDPENVNSYFRYGEIADVNSPANSYKKGKTTASMYFNKKGAGIFGDAAFNAQLLLSKAGLDFSNNPSSVSEKALGFGGAVISGMHQTLYQEGISAKKSGAEAMDLAATIQTMAGQAQTWNNEDTLRRFIGYLEELGIVGKKGKNFFKDNTLQKLGLSDLSKDKDVLKRLKQAYVEHAQSVEKRYGKGSVELKDINKQIRTIDKVISGKNNELEDLSKEAFIATIKMLNHESAFTSGQMWGDLVENFSYRFDTHSIPNLTQVTKNGLDDITEQNLKGRKKSESSQGDFQSRMQQIQSSKVLDTPAARVTTRAGRVVRDNKGGVPDAWFLLAEQAKEYAKLTDKKEREKYIKKRDKQYATMIGEDEAVLRAVSLGTVSHKMSEILQENRYISEITDEKQATEVFKKLSPGLYENYLDQMKYLFSGRMTDKEIEEALGASLYKGSKNIEYVRGKVAEAIENGGGGFIGTEIPLVSFTNPENEKVARGRGTSDIMYYTLEKYLDEEGKERLGRRIKIGDYKNTSHGQLELTNALQGMAYRQFVLDFVEDIHNKQKSGQLQGNFDAYMGFGSGDLNKPKDNFVDSLYWRLDEYAREESDNADKDSKAYREAYEKGRKKLADLYEVARGDVRGVDLEFYSHGANGILNEYKINYGDPVLQKLFAEMQKTFFKDADYIPKYDYSKKGYNPSEEESLVMSGAAERIASVFGGTEEQAEELFGKDYVYLKSLYEAKEARNQKLTDLRYQRKSLERQIPTVENKQKIEDLKKQEQEIEAKIGNQDDFDKIKDLETNIVAYKKMLRNTKDTSKKEAVFQELSQAEEQLKNITSSDYYRIRSKQEDMGKTYYDNYKGKDVAERYIEQRESIHRFNETVYDNYVKGKTAREDLESLNKDYDKMAKAAAQAEAASKSRLLDDKAKELAEAEAKQVAALRDKILENIFDTFIDTAVEDANGYIEKDGKKYSLIDAEGKPISKEDAEKLNLYTGKYTQTQDEYYKEALKDVERSDHSKVQAYENKVLSYYEELFKLQNQINKLQEQLSKAQSEGQEVETNRLSLELERISNIKKIFEESEKADFNKMEGANTQSHDNMKKLAELKNSKQKQEEDKYNKERQQSASGRGGNGGPGYSFLGIDAGVSRWLSRLMSGGMLYRFIAMIRRGLRSLTQEAKQLDQAMITLRIVTGKNAENARTLINQYADLGKKLGATAVEVTNVSSAWLRQGYDISQVNDLIKSSMYLSKLGMIDVNEAVKDLEIRSAK